MSKWKKWLSASLLTAILGTVGIAGSIAEVSANAGNRASSGIENLSPDELVPSVGSSSSKKVNAKAWKKIDGVCYNGSGKVIENAITRGIDVSEWQDKINWEEASKDLDFTFVRISYGTKHLDNCFEYNMTQAEAAKLIGISTDTLGNYERGKSYPDIPVLRKIEEVYGVKYSQLIFLPLDYDKIVNLY